MNEFVHHYVNNHIGYLQLDRPQALNSLSLSMVRQLSHALRAWQDDDEVHAVVIYSEHSKAFCAGGDIRFFYDAGTAGLRGNSPQLEDFFTEEYALNHLIHFYPKPYISVLNGVVMGGGMGIAQAGIAARLRIVTEQTKMAMPEVNIGLFPDVGGGYFLSRTPGAIGLYLGLTGHTIRAADALYADLADVYVPSAALPELMHLLVTNKQPDFRLTIREFAAQFIKEVCPSASQLAERRSQIDHHFQFESVEEIVASLSGDQHSDFASTTLSMLNKRSPLLMAVTLEQLRRGKHLSVADCLRMERTMVRHCFLHGEVLEGIRALVIDKDNTPNWSPAQISDVTSSMVQQFFEEIWPSDAHPLRHLS